jgi:hypothetical protein
MQQPRLSPAQSDLAAEAARSATAARAARLAAQAARVEAAAAERRALVSKAASARATALWGREKNRQLQDAPAIPVRHVRGLDQLQHCLEDAANEARQQARAELHAARSLRALQLESQRVGSIIDETLDAGDARRRSAIVRAQQRSRSNVVVEELELRFAWCHCVGTRARETGGTWSEQRSALSRLYTVLGQDGRDPTAVLVGAGGVPNEIAVPVEFWRFICAGLSLKYDLPTPEAIEVHHALVCGGTLAAGDRDLDNDWQRVRRDLAASSAGEDGAVRARRPRIGLAWHENGVCETDPVASDTSADNATEIHLSWDGAWTTLPAPEVEPVPPAQARDRDGSGTEGRRTAVSLSGASSIDAAALRRACVSAVGLGVSSAELMNDQARLMATRKQVQEYHPRLVAAQRATRNARRRKSEAAKRLLHAKMKLEEQASTGAARTDVYDGRR